MIPHRFKRFFIAPIEAYQYISRMLPGSCRYYPTCSEYAKWQFAFNAPHRALSASTLRILRCNQLFPGGIDYPIVQWCPNVCQAPCIPPKVEAVTYWLIPHGEHTYQVVKNL